MMDHSFLCVLGLFWLYTLLCTGHTQGAVLTIDPNWLTFYTGESVTFICDMKEGTNTDWEYRILKDGQESVTYNSHPLYELTLLHIRYKGEYRCCGLLKTSHDSKCSNKIFLNVRDKPRAEVTAGTTTISVGGSVTLSCSVDNSAGWKYQWFRRTSHTSEYRLKTNDEQNRTISVSQGGIYRCRGERGDPAYYSDMSNDASINIIFSNQVVVTRQPDWPQIFSGEKITLTCEIQGGETTEWMCVWRHLGSIIPQISSKQFTFTVSELSSGDYQCQCERRDDSYSSTKWSEAIRLSVSAVSRPESSSFPVLLMVGSVIGIILLIFLLLLCLCKRSKDLCCIRWIQSQSSSQSSSSHPGVNQNETNQYSSPLHDADESRDVTYSLIELKHFGKKRRHHEPEESCVYSEVKTGTAGKWSPAAGDAAVYSEVGLGAALDNNAAM
ncbi:Fc receptor-like protein 5 isoform X4 [Melanotaenia boesemani]|uniref:Fc receptor-like protein 5 isoform X4 n=1 Tax=Melanotaenia boesemani TaxID=1250792 RepID=UPI001C03CA14|nr:Fc receptor-like protein 5 isoform X4 [Melanotaenia boesemani]